MKHHRPRSLYLFSVGSIIVRLSPDLARAFTGAGKAFFSTLAATYLTGNASLTAAIWAAFILAGLNFFSTEAKVLPPDQPDAKSLPDGSSGGAP